MIHKHFWGWTLRITNYQCCGAGAARSRKEPHLLVGAGAVTRCGSGSDGSGSDNGIYHG
jgi:hypothetical protein